MSEVNGTVRKWAGGVVVAGACGVSAMLASCAVEPDGSTVESGGHAAMGEVPALVASSPEALRIVSEVIERYWIHVEPVMLDPDRGMDAAASAAGAQMTDTRHSFGIASSARAPDPTAVV